MRHVELVGGELVGVRLGLPASSRFFATAPSTTVPNRSMMPAARSTSGALAELDTIAIRVPRSSSASSRLSEPG